MILMEDIIKEGHPSLNKVSKEVLLPLTIADKKLLKDMIEFVKNSQDHELSEQYDLRPAVGIAAPQLNVNKRMFVIYVHDFDNILYEYLLVNPTLEILNDETIYLPGGEGCLSVERETSGITPRYHEILVKGYHYDYKADLLIPIELKLNGYIGIVFQHEYDHLEGVLFTEKLFDELKDAKPAFEITNDED